MLVYNANTVITLVEKTQILVFNGERRGLILLECFKNPMEHDLARAASRESLIGHHAHTTNHGIHPRYARILEHNEHNHHRRLFLESLNSSLAKNSANERAEFPRAYAPLLKSLRDSK